MSMNVLIYGAGEAGTQIADYCINSDVYNLVAFIDDDPNLHQKKLNNRKVYPSKKINELIREHAIQEIFLAIPSAKKGRYQEILRELSVHNIHLRTLPKLDEISNGKVSLGDIKEINIEDLLLRNPVEPIDELLCKNVSNRIVLITGAGGSIGSELSRQIIKLMPKQIILLDHAEFNLFAILEELYLIANKLNFSRFNIFPLLVSISDEVKVRSVVKKFRPDTIFHAAAYKHVSLAENNISAALTNNVLGTLYVAKAAHEFGVTSFTLISTDKAVRPTSIMGMTKRISEMILQSFSSTKFKSTNPHKTCFSIVRFGNVLGSSGSVVPIFREQLRRGGPITVTHPDVTRYFMTISEAAQLVIQASSLANGGDVFLLDMGEPIKIYELAKKMIWLSGMIMKTPENPYGDIEIIFTKLGPGEKLSEEMYIVDSAEVTAHSKILRVKEVFCDWNVYGPKLLEINSNNYDEIEFLCNDFLRQNSD